MKLKKKEYFYFDRTKRFRVDFSPCLNTSTYWYDYRCFCSCYMLVMPVIVAASGAESSVDSMIFTSNKWKTDFISALNLESPDAKNKQPNYASFCFLCHFSFRQILSWHCLTVYMNQFNYLREKIFEFLRQNRNQTFRSVVHRIFTILIASQNFNRIYSAIHDTVLLV